MYASTEGCRDTFAVQMDTKQESLGVRGESLETESQEHLPQNLRSSNSVKDRQLRLQLLGGSLHGMLGAESGSQLAARLNSSTFGTEQVLASHLAPMPYQAHFHHMPLLTCMSAQPNAPVQYPGTSACDEVLPYDSVCAHTVYGGGPSCWFQQSTVLCGGSPATVPDVLPSD